MSEQWIGVDLDGTLAVSNHDHGKFDPNHIGEPIPLMMAKVRAWVAQGKKVKVLTARAADPTKIPAIRKWLDKHGLTSVDVTNEKDKHMSELWDDKAVHVEKNTGIVTDEDNFIRQANQILK